MGLKKNSPGCNCCATCVSTCESVNALTKWTINETIDGYSLTDIPFPVVSETSPGVRPFQCDGIPTQSIARAHSLTYAGKAWARPNWIATTDHTVEPSEGVPFSSFFINLGFFDPRICPASFEISGWDWIYRRQQRIDVWTYKTIVFSLRIVSTTTPGVFRILVAVQTRQVFYDSVTSGTSTASRQYAYSCVTTNEFGVEKTCDRVGKTTLFTRVGSWSYPSDAIEDEPAPNVNLDPIGYIPHTGIYFTRGGVTVPGTTGQKTTITTNSQNTIIIASGSTCVSGGVTYICSVMGTHTSQSFSSPAFRVNQAAIGIDFVAYTTNETITYAPQVTERIGWLGTTTATITSTETSYADPNPTPYDSQVYYASEPISCLNMLDGPITLKRWNQIVYPEDQTTPYASESAYEKQRFVRSPTSSSLEAGVSLTFSIYQSAIPNELTVTLANT